MSPKPLVIAYHLIWTAYGWWLPNDPRGSGSRTIASDTLAELGEVHFGRKKTQPAGRVVREFYDLAAARLQHPLLTFTPDQIERVGEAFAEVVEAERYTCWACAVMTDHVHLCIRKHRDRAEDMMDKLKVLSRKRLLRDGRVPADHPVWAGGGGWKVFLDHPDDVRRTIRYIEQNPTRPQRWPFVKPYDNWPLHPGHSPNSPYVKALRRANRHP